MASMDRMDHFQSNKSVTYRLVVEGDCRRWFRHDTWDEAARDAIAAGQAQWANPDKKSLYLRDGAYIERVHAAQWGYKHDAG